MVLGGERAGEVGAGDAEEDRGDEAAVGDWGWGVSSGILCYLFYILYSFSMGDGRILEYST